MEGDLYRDNIEAIRKSARLTQAQQKALVLYIVSFVRNDGKRDGMLTSSELGLLLESGKIRATALRETLMEVNKRAFIKGKQSKELKEKT